MTMEAVAKYRFTASQEDELSFEKGSVVKVSLFILFFAILLDNYTQWKRRKEVYRTYVKHQPYQARPQS